MRVVTDSVLKEIYNLICITDLETFREFKEYAKFMTVEELIKECEEYGEQGQWLVDILKIKGVK